MDFSFISYKNSIQFLHAQFLISMALIFKELQIELSMSNLFTDLKHDSFAHESVSLYQSEIVNSDIEVTSGNGKYIVMEVITHQSIVEVVDHTDHFDGWVYLDSHGIDVRINEITAD